MSWVDIGSLGEARQVAAAHQLLRLVGPEDRVDYLPSRLSGGQRRRVAVARALDSNPEIVFADEATATLDKDPGCTIVELLGEPGRTRGKTTETITHVSRILELADRMITLEDGRIVKDTDLTPATM